LSAGLQSYLTWEQIRETGGTSWHGPTLAAKRDALRFISEHYPETSLLIATPGSPWSSGLTSWIALASLPSEFLGRWHPEGDRALVIEERGAADSPKDFADEALTRGWRPVWQEKSLILWEPPGPVQGIWPRVIPVTRRLDSQ
jgi:hypothetical protein